MKQISSILRHVRAVVENRMRIRALTSIKPNNSVNAFRLLRDFNWDYFQLESGSYVLMPDIPLPQKCLDALERATRTSWMFASNNALDFRQKAKNNSLFSAFLRQAFQLKASDIFLTLNKNFSSVKFRIKRNLTEPQILSIEEGKNIVKSLFALANIDQDNALYNREGHFRYEINGKSVFFRLSYIASEISQSLVLRLLSEELFPFTLPALTLPQELLLYLQEMSERLHSGMILISGSTGSGKTTTAYTLAKFFAQKGNKVVSLEDPIEAEVANVIQSEINAKKGYSFAEAMVAILRQDPNVILVGEIRDLETARVAFYASLSGYWVIATLHSETLKNVPFRCKELGISFSEFSDNVRLQIHQQWGQNDHPEFTWKKS